MNKFLSLLLLLTLAAFAQEQQQEHKNFTTGQRLGTFGLNVIPGLGSIVIMDDWWGAGIQWAFVGTGIVLIADVAANGKNRDECKDDNWFCDPNNNLLKLAGVVLLVGVDVIFNALRSATYDNPKYIQQLSENSDYKNFTVGQRFGTFGLNIIPGLGSISIMNDWAGAITQWILVGSGIFFIDSFGSVLIATDIIFNAYRSATYNKQANTALGKHDGFHLSVFPNSHGKVMPYLVFSKGF